MSSFPEKPNTLDIDEATRLVVALERDLAQLRQGSADLDRVRAEVEQLRHVLGGDDVEHGQVRQSLHGLSGMLHDVGDELATDAFKASDYAMRIGRLLGLT